MSRSQNTGYLVQHEDGRKGRTFHKDRQLTDRYKVYFEDPPGSMKFSDQARLVKPEKIRQIGFID